MPELNDVITKPTDDTPKVVDATVVEPNEAPESTLAPAETASTSPAETPLPKKEKKAKKSKEKVEKSEANVEQKLRRPPLEQVVTDFENYLTTLSIENNKIIKLGYKCGKIIFGLANPEGKDFRVVAYKARKKSKSVAGKSRCIFYFGLSKETSKTIKDLKGVKVSKFGKCSVQSDKPLELILDKVTFTEIFNQDVDKVLATLKQLADTAIEHKTEQYAEKQAKLKEKEVAKSKENKESKEDKNKKAKKTKE